MVLAFFCGIKNSIVFHSILNFILVCFLRFHYEDEWSYFISVIANVRVMTPEGLAISVLMSSYLIIIRTGLITFIRL